MSGCAEIGGGVSAGRSSVVEGVPYVVGLVVEIGHTLLAL